MLELTEREIGRIEAACIGLEEWVAKSAPAMRLLRLVQETMSDAEEEADEIERRIDAEEARRIHALEHAGAVAAPAVPSAGPDGGVLQNTDGQGGKPALPEHDPLAGARRHAAEMLFGRNMDAREVVGALLADDFDGLQNATARALGVDQASFNKYINHGAYDRTVEQAVARFAQGGEG